VTHSSPDLKPFLIQPKKHFEEPIQFRELIRGHFFPPLDALEHPGAWNLPTVSHSGQAALPFTFRSGSSTTLSSISSAGVGL
jgi:hypothetical protein